MEAQQRLVLMIDVEKNTAKTAFDGLALAGRFADFPELAAFPNMKGFSPRNLKVWPSLKLTASGSFCPLRGQFILLDSHLPPLSRG